MLSLYTHLKSCVHLHIYNNVFYHIYVDDAFTSFEHVKVIPHVWYSENTAK